MNLLITLALAAAFAEPAAPAKASPADLGKKVFAAKCASCHGKDGKGNDAMAKMFKVEKAKLELAGDENQKKSDAELTKVIKEGNGKMPKFGGKLKDEEIAGVVGYIRSLAPKAEKK